MKKLDYSTAMDAAKAKDGKKLKAFVLSAVAAFSTARDQIQLAAIAIISHAAMHGNNRINLVNDFCNDLKGARADLLAQWFEKFGGYTRTVGKSGFTNWEGKDYITRELLDKAKATMWYAKAPSDAFVGMDINKAIVSAVKKAMKRQGQYEKLVESGQTPAESVNLDLTEATINFLLNSVNFEDLTITTEKSVHVAANDADSEEEGDSEEAAAA